jgi:hypothetical protein
MESLIPLIIQALSGAAGGNIAGAVLKNLSLGPLGNSIAGILGGAGGGYLLQNVLNIGGKALAGGSLDISTIIQQVLGGGVSGGILMAVVGLIKSMMASGQK